MITTTGIVTAYYYTVDQVSDCVVLKGYAYTLLMQ